MTHYKTRSGKISGSKYGEVARSAFVLYDKIKKRTKRRPYLRSSYFKKEKVFLDFFRVHLFQKPPRERMKRLKYFKVAIELIENSRNKPEKIKSSVNSNEIFYKFSGLTIEGEIFFVQIKEDKKNKKKYFMSCFPKK